MTLNGFITLLRPDPGETTAVGTLGPSGTSSEVAATLLAHRLATPGGATAPVRLFDTYEEAGAALHAREVTHVVVANAYKAVHHFYMDQALDLSDVFVMDTPLYGIAVRRDAGPVPVSPTVASHPSPVPIIDQLLSSQHTSYKVIHCDSTSAAARAAVEGTADLALTTVPAAELHGLEFISRTRPIRMVWSVFTRPAPPGQSGRAA
ncbi:prephenate dehydratase domain-containing protein [Streptomyces malaysiensis]|uniref:prephenate dehydratase domain-containing protein n=1 Tax=Streptomyces malaysiensis TaxID=92644 RepID=UPI0037196083